MTTYKGIQGLNITAVASDPSNPLEGEIWYNTTAKKFRGQGKYVVAAAWSTSPTSLNSGRRQCEGSGTANNGIGFLEGVNINPSILYWNKSSFSFCNIIPQLLNISLPSSL